MTVPVSDRLSQLYVGNGINTRFDFTFRVFDQEDATGIAVRKKGSTDFETVDPSTYVVTINPDNMGGYITFNSPPIVGAYFYIAGATPLDQLLDITNYDNFYPDAIERALDKLTALLQEWGSQLDLEKQARILADIRYDSLAMEREEDLENRLISYINAVVGITNPKIFDGISDRMIITEDGRTQRDFNKSIPFWTNDYVNFKQETVIREQKILEHSDSEDERIRADLGSKISEETQRALDAEQNLQLQITTSNSGIKYFSTEVELLAFIPTASDPKQAYAFDTKKNYLWKLKDGSTTEYEWKDEGKSVLDLAEDHTNNEVRPLKEILKSGEEKALEIARDKTKLPFRITALNGDTYLTGNLIALLDVLLMGTKGTDILMLRDKQKNVFLRMDRFSDFHIPGDLKFDNGRSLVESVNNTKVSSEKLFKKHAGLTYQQALVNRLPKRSEFTSVMTLAESNGLINRMMSGIKTPTGLLLIWHQKTKSEYNGDTTGSAFWRGYADIDSNFNITIRDKALFIYPDTDAGIVKHPHLGRTSDNRIILVYEKSIGETEGTISYTRYVRYSSDEGVTWTDPVPLAYTNAPPTTENKALGTTCNILSLSSGRLIVPLYSKLGHCGCIYSDNDGVSWAYSDKFVLESNWGFEPSIALDSNDDLIMTMRPTSNNPMFAAFAKSTDDGVTWELMHKDRVVSVTNQSHLSYDKTLGVHFDSHDINPLNRRTNYRISLSYDDCYTFPLSYAPFADDRYVGYTQIIKWADGVYLLLMEYNDVWNGANTNEQLGIQLFTLSEIINNVTYS
ncbi:exo-alpha-sialidase [Acinetobacter baumannii]|uniref:sialidase family protein n=1 Tax=Acinetobacter baumannii TaxID=470 RepID=UPI003FA36156